MPSIGHPIYSSYINVLATEQNKDSFKMQADEFSLKFIDMLKQMENAGKTGFDSKTGR